MSATTTAGQSAGLAPASERDDPALATGAPPLGLIGLDRAGRLIGVALHAAGLAPLACDADAERRGAYQQAAGAEAPVVDDPAELGRRCGMVLLVLGLGEDAAAIHGALLTTMAPGGLIVDLSPALPGGIRRLAAELARTGLRLMDATWLEAQGVVLAAGAEADQAQAAPALCVLGDVVRTGPVGSAAALSALLAELDAPADLTRIRALAAQQAAPW